MTLEEHWNWYDQASKECVEIEIFELIKLAASGKKVVVDTNIPPDVLREISSYNRVVILLCDPPDICATRFFGRGDPDKKFMMDQIKKCPDPKPTLRNFNSCALYHSPVEIDWEHTGFFSYTRSDFDTDTREEMLSVLAKHFGLKDNIKEKNNGKQTNNILENLHHLCTWHYGENYLFNACMKFLMERIEPNPIYTYSFFAGITGDNFVQVYGHDYNRYYDCISVVWDSEELIKYVFGQIGYEYTFVNTKQLVSNKEMFAEKLKSYIDHGIPVIRKTHEGGWHMYVGYEENGKTLLYLEGNTTEPIKLNADNINQESWIFVGGKQGKPTLLRFIDRLYLTSLSWVNLNKNTIVPLEHKLFWIGLIILKKVALIR